MDLIEMYPAAVNSKVTVTLGVLNADSTIIEVLDGSVLPDAPTLLVLGSDQTAETVKLTAKEGNTLTVERGIQGNAIAWPAGTQIARNFTAKDWNDLIANVAIIVAKIMGLSAADVHARPDTWMPNASDVGAVAKQEALATSILEKALTLPSGIHHFRLSGGAYTGGDLPTNSYRYVCATVHVRQATSIQVVLHGTNHGIYPQSNYYDGNSWLGWTPFFLPLDGSVPMGESLWMNNGWGRLLSNQYAASLCHFNDQSTESENKGNRSLRGLVLRNSIFKDLPYALQLTDEVGKNADYYTIFGEHNKELLSGAEIAFPCADGITAEFKCTYYKDADGTVILNVCVYKEDGFQSHVGTLVGTLPVGYRPNVLCNSACALSSKSTASAGVGNVDVRADGGVIVYNVDSSSKTNAFINFTFKAVN